MEKEVKGKFKRRLSELVVITNFLDLEEYSIDSAFIFARLIQNMHYRLRQNTNDFCND